MESYVNIKTDATGKQLYQASVETCGQHALQLDRIHHWLSEIEKFEASKQKTETGHDFSTIKNLYQLQTLFIIASTDLTIITCQMHLFKTRLQHSFFNRQLNLTIYEAHDTYSSHKHFLRTLISKGYSDLETAFRKIGAEEKDFVRRFKIKSNVKEIRNKTGGHIHKDFNQWYQTVNTLDADTDIQMAITFIDLFTRIFNLSTTLTDLEHQRFIDMNKNQG